MAIFCHEVRYMFRRHRGKRRMGHVDEVPVLVLTVHAGQAAADRIIGDVREDGLAALIEELWFDGPKAEPSGQDLGSAWAQIESAGGQ